MRNQVCSVHGKGRRSAANYDRMPIPIAASYWHGGIGNDLLTAATSHIAPIARSCAACHIKDRCDVSAKGGERIDRLRIKPADPSTILISRNARRSNLYAPFR